MQDKPRRNSLDTNTERARDKRADQSAQKSVPNKAPLKEHGQPAWREVKPE